MKEKIARISLFSYLAIALYGCVEPIDVSSEVGGVESLAGTLVVEAAITTEERRQVVLVSRMQEVESDSTVNVAEDRIFNANTPFIFRNGLQPALESGATIQVQGSNGAQYGFEEAAPGTYQSLTPFGVQPGVSYRLFVRTADGREYESTSKPTPSAASLDSLYAERIVNDQGKEGMAIFTNARGPSDGDSFLRYFFEETYQVIAPNWTPFEFEILSEGNPGFGIPPVVTTVPRAREERVCYKTDRSSEILLVDSGQLENGSIERNLVRFLSRENPIIAHRYSILVRQQVISGESFAFYERLRNFAANDDVFSQIQPGPLQGNIKGSNGDDPVIGYFDVVSETSRRLFFNFADFFPGEPLPPFFVEEFNCDRLLSPPILDPKLDGPPSPDGRCPEPLVPRIKLGLIEYVDVNANPGICEGPYFVTPTVCGDCNLIGSNIVPDFWVE